MFLLWHPSLTAINLSYTFPILETSATALCGTTGNHTKEPERGTCYWLFVCRTISIIPIADRWSYFGNQPSQTRSENRAAVWFPFYMCSAVLAGTGVQKISQDVDVAVLRRSHGRGPAVLESFVKSSGLLGRRRWNMRTPHCFLP